MTPATRLLESVGVDFGVHEYEHADDVRDYGREAADALGLSADQVFKTLLVRTDGGAAPRDPVVVVVPVSCMVSMKLVAETVGAKRAAMCEPADAERITGYVVGGISPLGQRKRLVTVLDESVQLFDTIYVSGGRRGFDISIASDDLIGLLDATVACVTA